MKMVHLEILQVEYTIKIIEYLENTGNEKINKEGVLLDKDDQLALCQLRGFDNDSEMINNYINFYENVIVE